MFPPSSSTAIFMGCPISMAFFSAALITRRASSNFSEVMGFPLCVIRRLYMGGTDLTDRLCVRIAVVFSAEGGKQSEHRRRTPSTYRLHGREQSDGQAPAQGPNRPACLTGQTVQITDREC